MKKKISIVISLAFLCCALNSCEQEDQINATESDQHSIEVDKNAALPLQYQSLTKTIADEESCNETTETVIKAGQHLDVGKLYISNSDTKLFVTYDLSGTDWWLSETHLFAGAIEDAPFTKSGNPQMGKFPYHGQHDLTQQYTFCLSIKNSEDPISIIAHAVVVQKQNGQTTGTETAFGESDTEFSGNRWGWIINYQPFDCSEDARTTASDSQGTINTGNNTTQNDGCMDAYVYINERQSTCLLQDFDHWGWTNLVDDNTQHYVPGGVTYTYPLYASAYQCDIANSILIGQMMLTVQGGDSKLYANIEITLTNTTLSIVDANLYFGDTKYPLSENGQASISSDYFDLNLTDLHQKRFSADWIEWDDTSYFIAHVKVCPETPIS